MESLKGDLMRLQPCSFIVQPAAMQGNRLRGPVSQANGIKQASASFSLRLATPGLLARITGTESLPKKMTSVRNERGFAGFANIGGFHVFEGREEDKTKKIRKDLCEEWRRKSTKNTAFSNRQFYPIFGPATALGDLDRIKKLVKLTVLVATTESFTHHAAVADGASDLFVQIFGQDKGHVRLVYGVQSLPIAAPVIVDTIFEIKGVVG